MQENELNSVIKLLRKRKDELLLEVESINRVIKGLATGIQISHNVKSTASQKTNNIPDDYNSNWSNANKVLYFLKVKNRFLHFREIAKFIGEIENLDKKTIKKLPGKLSTGCQKLKKEKVIVKYNIGKGFTSIFWGSPKWLNSNGYPLKEHDCNREFIIDPHKDKSKVVIDL